MENLNLGDNLEKIQEGSFYQNNLSFIYIPDSVRKVSKSILLKKLSIQVDVDVDVDVDVPVVELCKFEQLVFG